MAPKKVTRKPVSKRTATSLKTNATENLLQMRRDFFTTLQTRIQALPATASLPSSVADEIRAYSRSQGSEKGMMKAVDCDVGQLNALLTFLLQPPNLGSTTLDILIQKFLASLVIQEELGLEEDPLAYLSYQERILHKIRKYVKENLSTFLVDLPVDAPKTDQPLSKIQKDLATLFPVDNPFSNLFESHIPAFYIKQWLAQTDFISPLGDLDIRRAVHQFIQDHRFHLLKDILEEGFSPKSPQDWEVVVGKEFFEKYPLQFWKSSSWEELENINKGLQKHSLSVHDYFRLLHNKDTASLIRVEEIKKVGTRRRLVTIEGQPKRGAMDPYEVPKNLLKMPTPKEMALHLRIRPDLEGFVTHLISPIGQISQDFLGSRFNEEYYFPSDRFYIERVHMNEKDEMTSSFTHNHLVLLSDVYDPPKEFSFKVAYLFKDGRLEVQTSKLFHEEQKFLQQGKGLQIPKLKQHLLESPLENLSIEDVDKVRSKIKGDLSTLLNQVFVQKMDTDAIVSEMENCFSRCKTLKEYLTKIYRLYLIVHPRYQFFSIFPEMKERLQRFFYHLPNLCDIPVSLLFPRYEVLTEELQETFSSWMEKGEEDFFQEMIMYLLVERYRFIRIPIPTIHPSSAPVALHATQDTPSFLYLVPYHGTLINLVDLANIRKNDEILVDGKPLPSHVLDMVRKYMDLDRIQLKTASFLEPTGFELIQEESVGLPQETPVVEIQPQSLLSQNLPGFKELAFSYLDELLKL